MKLTFHTFTLGDVSDVEIYAGSAIHEWQNTAHGKWVMENAQDLVWTTLHDPQSFGHKVRILGKLNDPRKVTEYFLKWPEKS